MVNIGMVAGEASGDMLAGLLLGGLNAQGVDHQSVGIGGPLMAASGFTPWWSYHELAVRGYVEVLRHYPRIVGIRRQLADRLMARKPDLFVGVDAPDFNLDLELKLRSNGIPTVHFVSPSIWAWRPERIGKIRAACDHVLCIFPFEVDIYERADVPATYVGHPLADVMPITPERALARAGLGVRQDGPVVALLPGSRTAEIAHLSPAFFAAAKLIHAEQADALFLLPAAPSKLPQIQRELARAGLASVDWLRVIDGQSQAVLTASDATLIASGTATLEAALAKCPMVIAYNMPFISWQIMKRKRLQPWVGLPNILAQRFVVPELLQSEVTGERLARETLRWLRDADAHAAACATFTELHHTLKMNTALVASDAIQKVIAR